MSESEANPVVVEQAAIKAALEILDAPGAEDDIKISQAVAVLKGQASVVEQAAPVEQVEQAPVVPVEASPAVRELVYSYQACTNSRPDAEKTKQRRTHLVALLESGQDVQEAF